MQYIPMSSSCFPIGHAGSASVRLNEAKERDGLHNVSNSGTIHVLVEIHSISRHWIDWIRECPSTCRDCRESVEI